MSPTVTIRDVARHAGVGVGTVSRVLNESDSVRESTRLKVQAAIKELDFSPSTIARSLSSGKTMAIGVIVPFFTNASVVRRLQGIVSVLGSSEFDLILFDVEDAENRDVLLNNIVQRKMVDGLLILSLRPTDNDMARFIQAGVPAVMVDAKRPELSSIFVDNVIGGKLATRHLINLGHEKIGYISDYPNNPFNLSPVDDRRQGFEEALQEAGIPFPPEYYREGGLSSEDAHYLAHDLLSLSDPPTAIFAYSDTQAVGVLEAARDLGLQVPEDLSVIGYDDIEAARFLQLTTIRQSLFDSGVKGAQLLLDIMDDPFREPQELELPTELIVRGSTAVPSRPRKL